MINASKARQMTDNKRSDISEILKDIKRRSRQGDYSMTWYYKLNEAGIKKLQNLGFNVIKDPRDDLGKFTISWE